MENTTAAHVLACPMSPAHNDAGASSVGGYLSKLLAELWREEERFDGKRPFGNSSWQHEVYQALYEAELINGDETDPEYVEYDETEGDRLVLLAIASLGGAA